MITPERAKKIIEKNLREKINREVKELKVLIEQELYQASNKYVKIYTRSRTIEACKSVAEELKKAGFDARFMPGYSDNYIAIDLRDKGPAQKRNQL